MEKPVNILYHAMDRLSNAVNRLLGVIAGVLIALCTAALLFQVLYRFVIVKFFSFSFPFTEEFARYALIWASYLCLGMCLKEGSQSSVNFLYDRLRGGPRLALYCVTRFFVVIFLVVAVYYGAVIVGNNSFFKSTTLRIPGFYLFSAPVAGCALMIYEVITELLGVLCGELEPFAAGQFGHDAEREDGGLVDSPPGGGVKAETETSKK
ncbi:MAG: TRAP transporter small permease [Planctomycetota bacterium]|jgi:TRAP-type C4-dicarboxylate transport system permease small subunit|nr:TRAP transporter small permease [Planctomycetota bacterium]